MNKEYNSQQRKIYRDYNEYSNENLLEILRKSEEYNPDILEIISDILRERNLMHSSDEEWKAYNKSDKENQNKESDQEIFYNEEKRERDEVVRSFVKKLNEKSTGELADIILRYIDYKPETVEAALFLSVEKGTISFDLKELLLNQIESNFAEHRKPHKQRKWESNNAFIQYVSSYQDDDLYNFIEDPKGIVLDVYHAILVTAKERELISEDDFTEYYKGSKEVLKTEDEIRHQEFRKFLADSDADSDFVPPSEAELVAETEKYWKCPSCNQMVEMEFGVCWNCQTEIPERYEHPVKEEVLEELKIRKSINPVKAGIKLIGGGLVLGAFVAVFENLGISYHTHYYRYVICGLVVLVGIFFVIIGLFFKSKIRD
jgi:hypothetical protein